VHPSLSSQEAAASRELCGLAALLLVAQSASEATLDNRARSSSEAEAAVDAVGRRALALCLLLRAVYSARHSA
jgi:hypothetical protein